MRSWLILLCLPFLIAPTSDYKSACAVSFTESAKRNAERLLQEQESARSVFKARRYTPHTIKDIHGRITTIRATDAGGRSVGELNLLPLEDPHVAILSSYRINKDLGETSIILLLKYYAVHAPESILKWQADATNFAAAGYDPEGEFSYHLFKAAGFDLLRWQRVTEWTPEPLDKYYLYFDMSPAKLSMTPPPVLKK